MIFILIYTAKLIFFSLITCNGFQEGESKKRDRKSEDEESISKERFEEMQEKVRKSILQVNTGHMFMKIILCTVRNTLGWFKCTLIYNLDVILT